MRFRQVGISGLNVSVVGLGCNNFGTRVSDDIADHTINRALDAGVTLFDTAELYGDGRSEEILGRALRSRRDQAVIATKFGYRFPDRDRPSASRSDVMASVERSLRRLATEWIDLYQIHSPDPLTPLEETLDALDTAVQQGKIRYIGTSNFEAWRVVDADWIARTERLTRCISTQHRYSLIDNAAEDELIPACHRLGIGFLPYYPLANGLLSGKYHRGEPPPIGSRLERDPSRAEQWFTPRHFDILESLEALAKASGHTLLELAIAGLGHQQAVASVIAGATSPEQVELNARVGDIRLSEDERIAVREAMSPPSVAGHASGHERLPLSAPPRMPQSRA
jgi:aryl-alcohol dehydrogenase-like predicted oxidoreductase